MTLLTDLVQVKILQERIHRHLQIEVLRMVIKLYLIDLIIIREWPNSRQFLLALIKFRGNVPDQRILGQLSKGGIRLTMILALRIMAPALGGPLSASSMVKTRMRYWALIIAEWKPVQDCKVQDCKVKASSQSCI